MAGSVPVSVVIPCYNGARFLRETLASVLAQTAPPREILVIDDGSTDDSAAVAAAFGPPVRVLSQTNQGESAARNRGFDEARGGWVAFLDADDLWDPAKLERQLAGVADGAVAVCTGHHVLDGESGRRTATWTPRPELFAPEPIFEEGAPCLLSTLIVRADAPVRFPTWTRYAEDALFLLELARRGPVRVVPEPLAGYRCHAASQSRSIPDAGLRWHESFDRWVTEFSGIEDARERRRLRVAAVGPLTRLCQLAYWRGDHKQLAMVRDYLAARPDLPGVAPAPRTGDSPREWSRAQFDRWIADYAASDDARESRRLQAVAVSKILRLFELAYWRRDWDQFELLRDYLAARRDLPGVAPALRARRYPRWCYRMKDLLDTVLGGRPARHAAGVTQ